MSDSSRAVADRVEIGAGVPRTHRPFLRRVARVLLRICGWRLDVRIPDAPKLVLLAAPHTSNWDGFFAIVAMIALDLRLGLFVKHTMFNTPLAGMLKALGAIPIDRTAAGGLIGQTIQAFNERHQLLIGLAPEGTRRPVEKWKRGFHLIATGAGVPVVCAYLDYRRKVVGTGLVIKQCTDFDTDLQQIQAFYRTVTPCCPENFSTLR